MNKIHLIDAAASDRVTQRPRPDLGLVEWTGVNVRPAFARGEARSRMDGRSAPGLLTVQSLLMMALAAGAGADPACAARVDSVYGGRQASLYAPADWRGACDSMRADAGSPSTSSGLLFARDLEYIYSRVSEEKVANLNALQIFGIDSSVPVGATSHTVRRFGDAGEASFYKAGMGVPTVSLAAVEESFGVAHLVAGLEIDFFEALSHGFAGLREYERKLRAVRKVIDRMLNRIAWFGSKEFNLYGVLNYPHVVKRLFAETIDAPTTAAEFDAMLAAFNAIANRAAEAHKETAAPNRMVTSPRIMRFMAQTHHPQYNTSLMDQFLRDQALINRVESAWELQEAGPSSTDVILLFDDRDPDARPTFEMVQPFATLPVQNDGFSQKQVGYATTGGMVIRDVRAASINYATVSL